MPDTTKEPKFTITGETLQELALSFTQAVLKSGVVAVKDNKSGKAKYGIWTLDDGSSSNPYDSGMLLSAEQAAKLNTPAGAPLKLSLEVVMRQLTPVAQLPVALAGRETARAATIAGLKAKLAALEGK